MDHFLSSRARVLCKKVGQKLYGLARISRDMDFRKLHQLTRALTLSHFCYCPLVWMFYDIAFYHEINHIHKRLLRIADKDNENDVAFFLEQPRSVLIPVRNVQLPFFRLV